MPTPPTSEARPTSAALPASQARTTPAAQPTSPVLPCAETDQFIELAATWEPGLPFPVLRGPALDRYEALFPGALPAVTPTSRPGLVISVGGRFSKAVGQLLATATSRPFQHLPTDQLVAELAELRGELVAVVGLADEVTAAGDWPGHSGALVGVVTARSEQALACLVYRTLTVGAADADRAFVASHPLLEGAAAADATTFAELEHIRGNRSRLLVLRGQGRECCNSVLDGMVCGRDDRPSSTPVPLEPGHRATPCLLGEGCFRTDLTEAELLPARDVHATLVFTHSCSSISIGTNAYPLRLSVSLGLLDGTAVAVIGVLGVHVLQVDAQYELEDALAEGLPLGQVVARMQDGSPLRGHLSRFGLLGDPALVVPWSPRMASSVAPRETRRRTDEAVLSRLVEFDQITIPRLEAMRWLYLDVPETDLLTARKRVREIFSRGADPAAAALVEQVGEELAAIQHRMTEALVARIYSPGWDPSWVAIGFRQVAQEAEVCPNCRRPIAARLLLQHRVEASLKLQTLQCRRCGDVWWTTEPGELTIALAGPLEMEAKRGESTHIEREVVNLGERVLRGGVGYAFRARKNLGLPPGAWEPCRIEPFSSHRFRTPVDLRGCAPPADTHTTPVVAILNGIYVSSMVMLHLA